MKSYLLALIAILSSFGLFAQTPDQLSRVKKETNSAKLLSDANKFKQQSEERKAIAIQAAIENDWPIKIETENSYMEIQELDKSGNPMYYTTFNADAAESTSTDQLYSGGSLGLSLDGSGMTAGEWDGGGVLTSHQEFNNTGSPRATQGDSPSGTNYHATHVAGTIIAGGVQVAAKGMAYNASLSAYDWNNDNTEMATEAAAPNNLLISNHSYGYVIGWYYDGGWNYSAAGQEYFGYYYSATATWDQIAVDAPYYLIVKSAGNDRGDGPTDGAYPQDGPYDCIPPKGVAKNILTVGAVEDVSGGYSGDPNDVVMTSFSSWGPADDGRIKPDICGNGYGVYSTDDDANNDYRSLNGTSMSSPNVTGSLLLLQEHYYDLNSAWMKSASLKGLAIQSADECGPDDGPDYMFGWGLLNTKTAANIITNRNVSTMIEEETYNGTNYTLTVTANGTDPLRATLVWTDPAGTPPSLGSSTPMLVNDLDMTITGAKTTYYPYILDKDNPSNAATTGDNDLDNVEQIHIASPTNTSYTITITHEGTINGGSQDFSLIISGIDIGEPAVITSEPSAISSSSATFSGEVTASNGSDVSARGFVYGENEDPNIDDDTVVPLGSGLGSFNTNISGLNANTTYHVRAYATNDSGTGYGDNKDFTTTATTTWNGSDWDAGTPTAAIHAVIDGNYTTSGDLECNNLTINSGKTFNISANHGVTVNGDLVNNGFFNIKSNADGIGSLITLGNVTNIGTLNMERYVTENAWHYISSPLSGNTADIFTGSYLQKWDETTATWTEIVSTSESLAKGNGYSLWSDSKTNLFTFTGTPYSGNQSISMSKTVNSSGYDGANLLGNPFPSSVDWDLLDGIGYGAKYTYDGDNETYLTYNGGGSGSRYIAPGQGFFIVADYTGTFNLGNSDRVNRSTDDFVKGNNEVSNGVVLKTEFNNSSDEVWIEFVKDASNDYERQFDAYKFFSPRMDLPQIYTRTDNTKFSIDRRPETNTIQLGFLCQTNGNYSINISQLNGMARVELEDTKNSKIHDLLSGPYEFEWLTSDLEERFLLHLSATSTNEINSNNTIIYSINNHVYILQDQPGKFSFVKVFNAGGQLMYENHLEEKNLNRFAIDAQNGVYLVQLIGENQQLTEKIFIK